MKHYYRAFIGNLAALLDVTTLAHETVPQIGRLSGYLVRQAASTLHLPASAKDLYKAR